MTKFNKTIETKTVNLAGGQAYNETPKIALITFLLNSFIKKQAYRSEEESIKDLKEIIGNISDKKFIAKAAVYARDKFGMRSVSHLVASEIGHDVKGVDWTKNFFEKVIIRPDDMTEIASCYLMTYGKPMPNCMKKGLAKAFTKFNGYKLAKYKGKGKAISLIDLANLVHPIPTVAINRLMKGTLKPAKTWEVKMTQAGQKAKSKDLDVNKLKSKEWTKLVKGDDLGYFALLRNLRNIHEQSPEAVDTACETLINRDRIKKSRVLPFRFMTAVRQLESDGIKSGKIYRSINQALEISFDNIPILNGKTLVVVDHSGSMDSIEHGNISNFEIGALMGVSLAKTNDADFMYFGNDAKYAAINPVDSTPTIVQKLNEFNHGFTNSPTFVGHGTNFNAIFEEAKESYDRILIFSDMQGWIGGDAPTHSFNEYKKRTGANPKIYSFDLAGYGTLQFPENNVYILAGFSDKVFDLLKLLEQDRKALIHEIEKVEL
jgi:hypothetical protein